MGRKCLAKGEQWALLILALFGAGMVLFASGPYGIGLSPDSVGYVATARHLAAGRGAVTYDGKPLVVYPPLYPLLLALASRLSGIDPLPLSRFVQALLFGMIVYLGGILFFLHLRECRRCAFLGALSVLVGYPILRVSVMAWSEPLFIVLVLLYLFLAAIYVSEKDSTPVLLLMALSIALAALTRYIGGLLIVAGLVDVVLAARRSRTHRVRFGHMFLLLLVSVLPLGLWLIRNHMLTGTLTGPRGASRYGLAQNILLTAVTLLSWYLPLPGPAFIARYKGALFSFGGGGILLLLLLSLAIAGFVRVRRRQELGLRCPRWDLCPAIVFLAFYVGGLLLSATWVAYDRIGDRLLAPIYIPWMLLLWATGYHLWRRFAVKRRFRIDWIVVFMLVLLVHPTASAISTLQQVRKDGLGYNGRLWARSETIRYLQSHASQCPLIYTNDPLVVYVRARRVAKMSPHKRYYNSPTLANHLQALRGTWPGGPRACLVWFDEVHRDYLFPVAELATVAHIKRMARLSDGTIYLVDRWK